MSKRLHIDLSPEIKKIKETRKVVSGFQSFIKDYNVAPLAVGVVIGSAVNELVRNLVDGIIYPLVAVISPNGRLQNLVFTLRGTNFKIGAVLNSMISFLVVCAVVYFFIKYILRDEKVLKKEQ